MKSKWQLSALETALFAMFGGLMFASKVLMARIPNVHLIALFIMVLTTVYRVKALFPIAIYILLEGLVYGFSVWWIPYLYLWPLLFGVVMLLPKKMSDRWRLFLYPVIGLLHGLSFGTLFAPVHALAFHLSFKGMIAWIAAGFPWDVVHGVSNFVLAFLSVPLIRLIRKMDFRMRSSEQLRKQELTMIKNRQIRPISVFFLLTGTMFLASAVYLFFTHGAALDQLVFQKGNDHFMDFFNHIDYVKHHANVYFESPHACFPPLIYFMYYVFGHVMPEGVIVRFQAGMTGGYAYLLYAAYTAVLSVLFAFQVSRFFENRKTALGVSVTVLLSELFLFHVLERGNSVMIVVVLLLIAVSWKDSDSPLKRELALILIAVAAAVKLYPAVFGLLYLREKRWKEAIRLTVYGILLFALPFAFFGGFHGFLAFLRNQQTIQTTIGAGFGSIKTALLLFGEKMSLDLSGLSSVLPFVFAALFVFFAVISKERWVRLFFLTSIMTLVPFWSGSYTRILFAVPLVVFLSESESGTKKAKPIEILPAVAFSLIFGLIAVAPQRFLAVFQDTPATVIREAGIWFLMIFLMVRESVGWIRSLQKTNR